jgi:DNA polymerase Ligase (LigD)
MPRFVILTHDWPFPHYDLMLESGKVLCTWRLTSLPAHGAPPVAAEPLGDHRNAYLDYEGPVSGGRGEVRRWDAGDFEWEHGADEKIVIRLRGVRLTGRLVLLRLEQRQWVCELGPESG